MAQINNKSLSKNKSIAAVVILEDGTNSTPGHASQKVHFVNFESRQSNFNLDGPGKKSYEESQLLSSQGR